MSLDLEVPGVPEYLAGRFGEPRSAWQYRCDLSRIDS
jgi:hypothetical protein